MFAPRTVLRSALVAVAALSALPSHALFSDDEARRAIIELRDRVETNRQATDAALRRLEADLARSAEESVGPTRRGMLDLANQIETLRTELATLRGQNEQLARAVAELQRQQKDVLAALDDRLRALEPLKVQLDGVEFSASPAEKRDFEAAMAELRKTEFPAAAKLYQQFVRRYPDSGYLPAAYYWLGNTHYALREYKEAIATYRQLMALAPKHVRVPEAMLAIANCEIELKDVRAAKRTLEELVKAHPQTEAGATARERLARLR